MTIITDFYNKVLNFFNNDSKEQDNSKSTACNRLKLVLMQDRAKLEPVIMEKLRSEMIDVISKYIEIDTDALGLNLEAEGETFALMLNIPVIRAKTREEIEEAERLAAGIDEEDDDDESDDIEENEFGEEDSDKDEDESDNDDEPEIDDEESEEIAETDNDDEALSDDEPVVDESSNVKDSETEVIDSPKEVHPSNNPKEINSKRKKKEKIDDDE